MISSATEGGEGEESRRDVTDQVGLERIWFGVWGDLDVRVRRVGVERGREDWIGDVAVVGVDLAVLRARTMRIGRLQLGQRGRAMVGMDIVGSEVGAEVEVCR